jgi:hypothetical protein
LEAIVRSIALLFGVILASVGLVFSQASHKPISAFDQQLVDQQQRLLQAAQSRQTRVLDELVAEDFQGIGKNGDFYERGEIVDSGDEAIPPSARAYDFRVVKLSDDSAVVAYDLIVPGERPRYRHMSDTWAKVGGRWRLKFRQMTPNIWSAQDFD